MELKTAVEELKKLPVEQQAKKKFYNPKTGYIPFGIALFIGIIYMTNNYLTGATLAGFLLILLVGFVISAIFSRIINEKWNREYNDIIKQAKKTISDQKEAERQARKEERDNHVQQLYGENRKVVSFGGKIEKYEVVVNDEKAIIRLNENDYKYSDIIDFKVTDQKKNIYTPAKYETKTNSGSMLGRAVVGGILTGGVGAVIGGATASKETVQVGGGTHEVTHDYRIIVYLNNIDKPQEEIRFWKNLKAADEVASILTYIVNKNNVAEPKNTSSISDELLKLAELKEKGILTEEEFAQQKAKLLS